MYIFSGIPSCNTSSPRGIRVNAIVLFFIDMFLIAIFPNRQYGKPGMPISTIKCCLDFPEAWIGGPIKDEVRRELASLSLIRERFRTTNGFEIRECNVWWEKYINFICYAL